MRQLLRREPWMALCAAITCAAASVLLAIHLLGTLGIIRDYAVRVGTASSWRAQRQFGIGVPSTRLTDTDRVALWVWGIFGTLWLLRLARRATGYRIGVLRALGIATGFFWPFVVVGAMDRIDAAVPPERRLRGRISLWRTALVISALFIGIDGVNGGDPAARLEGLGWSVGRHAAAFGCIAGGLGFAMALTRRWARTDQGTHNSARAARYDHV